MIKDCPFEKWPERVREIYEERFVKQQDKIDKIIESSVIGSSMKQMKKDPILIKMEKETSQLIREHLESMKEF